MQDTPPGPHDPLTSEPYDVGFDIETTGVDADSILTVACAWTPHTQVSCFNGDDFTPILSILDNARYIFSFNAIGFDLPRLAKHVGREDIGPWVRKTVDPLYLMKNVLGFGACMKLNDVLLANGFQPKSGSGLQAIEFWYQGRRKELADYCVDDCRLSYLLCVKDEIRWKQWIVKLREPRVVVVAPLEKKDDDAAAKCGLINK